MGAPAGNVPFSQLFHRPGYSSVAAQAPAGDWTVPPALVITICDSNVSPKAGQKSTRVALVPCGKVKLNGEQPTGGAHVSPEHVRERARYGDQGRVRTGCVMGRRLDAIA